MTIDEIEAAIRLLSSEERSELRARLKVKKTPLERLLNGVNGIHLLLEMDYLRRVIDMRKEKRLKKRDWKAQENLIRKRLKSELDKEKSEFEAIKHDADVQIENELNTMWKGNEGFLENLRRISKGKLPKKYDEEMQTAFNKAFYWIKLRSERIDMVFQFMDEIINSNKRPPRKPQSWTNRYISWRTHQPLSSVKKHMTDIRKAKRQSQA